MRAMASPINMDKYMSTGNEVASKESDNYETENEQARISDIDDDTIGEMQLFHDTNMAKEQFLPFLLKGALGLAKVFRGGSILGKVSRGIRAFRRGRNIYRHGRRLMRYPRRQPDGRQRRRRGRVYRRRSSRRRYGRGRYSRGRYSRGRHSRGRYSRRRYSRRRG